MFVYLLYVKVEINARILKKSPNYRPGEIDPYGNLSFLIFAVDNGCPRLTAASREACVTCDYGISKQYLGTKVRTQVPYLDLSKVGHHTKPTTTTPPWVRPWSGTYK